ncbi:hypothetical protein Aph01nite_09170 [Acrocarpospora phusangensis]|uniref:Methyltransferase type 12 domain-containing protein n=1 Tax=Acrocarpospora phusangensis TaxID=1070424 RepID=A0A919ULU8_9ACTN|nr:class I SAM-dependent methyltransferase [Acrocarpospora phusangensis]GIH22607.1 hypothetical protein Aph01nite_09170 [Acrocarpospora phusangensis]
MSRTGDTLHRAFFGLMSRVPLPGMLGGYFDWRHRRPDPWRYTTDPYERERHVATLGRLPERDYRRILDVGCSEGTFTDLVATSFPRAETTGVDISAHAIRAASARKASPARFARLDIRRQLPSGSFDLVICTEMLYYLGDSAQLREVSSRIRGLLTPGGLLAVAHPWPESGRLHRHFAADSLLTSESEHVLMDERRPFAIALFERRPRPAGEGPRARPPA